MVDWPKALVRELADRRVLVFVGAGISKAAHPPMPSWSTLITDLATDLRSKSDIKLVKSMLRNGRMLDAAQIVSEGIDRTELNNKLRDTFQIRPIPPHDLYKWLLNFDPKIVATTNYDEFIEKNFDRLSGGNEAYSIATHSSNDLIDKLRSPTRIIIKMHGCVTDVNGLVLDRVSYFKARKKNFGFFRVLESIFTVNTILFIGYSISDPDLQLMLENVHMFSENVNGHYALIEKQEHKSIKRSMKETYNINCIEFPSGGFANVPTYIEELWDDVLDSRNTRGIP